MSKANELSPLEKAAIENKTGTSVIHGRSYQKGEYVKRHPDIVKRAEEKSNKR